MYAKHGVHLIERGWPAVIPLVPKDKRPSINGWQKYNTAVVSPEQAERWAHQYPDHGVGHAAGHGLVGIDLDTDRKHQANRARSIADNHLGPTPMIRVGRIPRVMRYYRLTDGTNSGAKTSSFHLFGVYATTGQTAWFGIHPKTARPYNWPDASPLDIGPSGLPIIRETDLMSFVDEMTTVFPAPVNNGAYRDINPSPSNLAGGGATSSILREMGLSPHTPPIKIASRRISSAAVGTRHHTMVGAVIALAHAGLGDQEIFNAVFLAHVESLSGDRPDPQTRRVVESAIRWARSRVGASLRDLDEGLRVIDWSIWR